MDMIECKEMGETSRVLVKAATNLARYALVKEICRGKRVLDVACGDGYGSALMATAWGATEVVGVDFNSRAVQSAQLNFGANNVRFEVGKASSLVEIVGMAPFDLVVSLDTIVHLDEPERFLDQVAAVTGPNSTIVISCPNGYRRLATYDEPTPFRARKFHFEEFLQLAEGRLGPATASLVGTRVDGFVNAAAVAGSGHAQPEPAPLSITEVVGADTLVVPPAEEIGPESCAYFVGWWSPAAPSSEVCGALLPIPLDSEQSPEKGQARRTQVRTTDERVEPVAKLENRLREGVPAPATRTRMVDERIELLTEYRPGLDALRERFSWELAGRDSVINELAGKLTKAQERLTQLESQLTQAHSRVDDLALLEVSPKAQVRALRRALPRSARKRLRNLRSGLKRQAEGSGSEPGEPAPHPRPHPGWIAISGTTVSLGGILRDVIGSQFDSEIASVDEVVILARSIGVGSRGQPKELVADPPGLGTVQATLHLKGSTVSGPLDELITKQAADLWTFDVWDTLIERRRPPDAAKTATARRMVLMPATLPRVRRMDTFSAAQIRCDVEAELARTGPSQEYELEDVLGRTLQRLGHPPGARCGALASELAELEVLDEIRCSRPRSAIVDLANAPDRDVVLVSDFYMRGSQLQRIVREVAQIEREVVVSVDRDMSKRVGGELLAEVRTERNVAPDRHVHVGDNTDSDIRGQIVGGGIAIHVERNPEFVGAGSFSARMLGQCWDALAAELDSLASTTDDVYKRAGQLLAPLAACLSARGVEEAYRLGVDRVHYVSREGLFLSRIHEQIEHVLRPPGAAPVSAIHLEVSRRSTFGASLEEPFRVSLQRLWSMYPNHTVEAMLVSIGLAPEVCADELQAVGLTNDTFVKDASSDRRLIALLESPGFARCLRHRAAESRSLLRDYIVGKTEVTSPFLIVDIGWRGTIQDNLVRAMNLGSAIGVYLGLFPFLNAQPSGSSKLGIAFDGNIGDDCSFVEPPAALERPWTPQVPSTIGYRRSGCTVVPIQERESGSVSAGIAAFQEGTLEAAPIVADWLVSMGLTVDQLKPHLGALAQRVWADPPAGLADIWFDSDHDDSFGALNVIFAKERPGNGWYRGPLRDHVRRGEQTSRWPAGYRSWTPVRSILDVAAHWGKVDD